MALAKQTVEPKSYPWPKASNVKYPLLSTAAMQFAARAYPSLIPSDGKVVKARVVGKDPTGEKLIKAERISTYMSWQLLTEMEGWEESMDKLLIMLPILGTVFKKTYWDSIKKQNCSEMIPPKDLVVNYWTKTLKDAERVSHILSMSPRKLKERQMAKLYLDIDLGTAPQPVDAKNAPQIDDTTPYTIIEQHTYLDLDDDGYAEPYIVTFHKESKKVLRISARYDDTSMVMANDGSLIKIEPVEYFTKFGFIPNPDGGFYDIGFGILLGPLNESVNTLINQLVDAGTLNNLQGGFIGKGLRLRMGETKFTPGEWKPVNATGDDLKKQIVPLPSKEPSNVLFQLMESLITSGKELASVAEIFVGKMPGQNTPATTTMASIEQGMKVFTAVYKRLYRSLQEEFKKIYRLNGNYLNPNQYTEVLDAEINPEDFDLSTYDVAPGADPTGLSQTERLMKAQGLMELLPSGILDPVKVVMRVLQAQEQPNWEELVKPEIAQSGQMPAPPPDPKLQEMQMKGQLEQQKAQMQGAQLQQKMELEARDAQTKLAMKAQEHALDMQHKAAMANVSQAEALHKQRIFSAQAQQDMNLKLVSGAAQHTQKMQQMKETAKVKQPTKGEKSK